MIIGELYLIKEFFWFLFPTKELAAPGVVETASAAAWNAKWLSERYKCNVSVVEENTYVVLLEVNENERCYKLLDSNGNIGWISCSYFSKYFEVVKANQ